MVMQKIYQLNMEKKFELQQDERSSLNYPKWSVDKGSYSTGEAATDVGPYLYLVARGHLRLKIADPQVDNTLKHASLYTPFLVLDTRTQLRIMQA